MVSSLNALVSAVFLAHKQARYILAISIILGLSKILLPLLIAPGNALTIFAIAGMAQLTGLMWGFILMRRKFSYAFSALFDINVVRVVRKFSFSMYASSILNLLPPTLLPILVVHIMGPANAAYYYMAFTIAGALYTIAYASMQSVFAEGSHNATAIHAHAIKALKLVTVLLLPASLLITALASFILGWFGQEYAQEATALLRLFALGALPIAVYSAMGAIFKVTKNLRGIVCMNAVYAVVTLSSAYWLMPSLGLVAIGVAWIIGNMAACAIGALFLLISSKKHKERIYGKITSTRR
jgi:O-antigen/teichoic acid export membrane protein